MPEYPSVREDSGSPDRDPANPDPNPSVALGPLSAKIARTPHHLPVSSDPSPSGFRNPFAPPEKAVDAAALPWETIAGDLPFGLIVLGPRMELLYENGTCREWLGTGVTEEGGIEEWLSALCPDPSHREKVLESWRTQIWRNQLTRVFSLKGKNQKMREIEFRSTLQGDGGMTVILQDVSDTFRAREIQRQGKLKFRALFDHCAHGVALLDRNEKILEANPAFLELVRAKLRDLRLTPFADLLHSASLADWRASSEFPDEERIVRLLVRNDPDIRRVRVRRPPREASADLFPNSMIFLEDAEPDSSGPSPDVLIERLRTVARKAHSLLQAVPDLILLINEDLTIADFSPPPERWQEHHPTAEWRGESIETVWPVLGKLIAQSQKQVLEEGKTIRAELKGRKAEALHFSAKVSRAGDGQILAVVRNQSELIRLRQRAATHQAAWDALPEAILFFNSDGTITGANAAAGTLLRETTSSLIESSLLERTSIASISELLGKARWAIRNGDEIPGLFEVSVFETSGGEEYGAILSLPPVVGARAGEERDPFVAEQAEHQFRNQLQLATSLHQFEPVTPESREASLRWQIRLRTLMAARPDPATPTLRVSRLLHDVAEEISSLSGRGPGSRCVSIRGSDDLILAPEAVTSLGLFVGEVLRIVLTGSAPSSGPDLYFRFLKDRRGFLQLQFQCGPGRHRISEARAWEGEILEILAAQMQGALNGRPVGDDEEWTLRASVLAPGS